MCSYTNHFPSAASGQWQVYNTQLGSSGNVEVRRKATGFYLGVTLGQNQEIAVLSSPSFAVNRRMTLRFNYNRGTFGSELYYCKNRFDRTQLQSECTRFAGPELTLDEWNGVAESEIPIEPNDSRVRII